MYIIYILMCMIFLKLDFTPCKAEQSLRGMELLEKEVETED